MHRRSHEVCRQSGPKKVAVISELFGLSRICTDSGGVRSPLTLPCSTLCINFRNRVFVKGIVACGLHSCPSCSLRPNVWWPSEILHAAWGHRMDHCARVWVPSRIHRSPLYRPREQQHSFSEGPEGNDLHSHPDPTMTEQLLPSWLPHRLFLLPAVDGTSRDQR